MRVDKEDVFVATTEELFISGVLVLFFCRCRVCL